MKSIIVVATLLLATLASAADRKTEEILVVVANVADLISTEVWLNNGPYLDNGQLKTPMERNPLARGSFTKRVAIKAGTTAATLLIARLWDCRGHTRAASTLRWSATVTYFGVAGWNASLSIRF